MVFYHHPMSDPRVGNARAGANLAFFPDHRISFEVDIRINDRVAAHLRVSTNVDMGGIYEGNSAFQHELADSAATQHVLNLCQFSPCIYPGDLARVWMKVNSYGFAFARQKLRDIRKIILSLLIDGLNAIKCVKERLRLKTVETGIYLA